MASEAADDLQGDDLHHRAAASGRLPGLCRRARTSDFSEGVTPENNSAVLFWKAVGPGGIVNEYRAKYFQMLGIPPLPEKGDYFVDLEKYLAQQKDGAKPGGARPDQAADAMRTCWIRPCDRAWSKDEFPLLAAWLAANEKPLALLAEASRRPRCYDPLVCGEKTPLIAVLSAGVTVFHSAGDVGSALAARAMLRLSSNKVERGLGGSIDVPSAGPARRPGPNTGARPLSRGAHRRDGVRRGPGISATRASYGGPDCEHARRPRPAAPIAQDGRQAGRRSDSRIWT